MNGLDFGSWGDLEARIWENNVTDIKNFKEAIAKEWEAYPQVNIDDAINS